MSQRLIAPPGAILALILIAVFLMPSPAAGQLKLGTNALNVAPAPSAEAKPWAVGKTPDEQPDLQGYWTNNTMTPLQRPGGVTKESYTKEEFFDALKKQAERDGEEATPGTVEDVHYDHSQFGLDRTQGKLTPNLRTSMITDPTDGRIPPMTQEGKKRAADLAAQKRKQGAQYDQAENLSTTTRCIYMGAIPMIPPAYNNNYQIVQGPGYVMILVEELHETRVIPMDGRPHAPQSVRSWLGDSRGHWEGNTLVIETTNFNDKVAFQGGSRDLKLTERLTRTGEDTMKYEFTVEDPHTWTQPWKAEMPVTKGVGPIFEHACNEGNYSMSNMLAAARRDEKKAAEAAAKKGNQ
ncbi:MAG TPA: hypothetical protein VGK48_21745 [Terriglobia bacterium]|jgi:hypothetical protein